jgi:DNA-binding SARP family transcriptional activator
MAQLKLHLFGAPCIERDGRRLSFQRRKALALLAYLSVQGRPQGREALATLLWPELDGPRARGNLRRELSLLRDALGDGVLGGNRVRLELDTGALWVDALVFREQVAAAAEQLERAGAVDERGAGALSTAVAMYNGDFLAGIQLADSTEFEEWHFQEAESLRHTLGWALGQLASWHMRQGAYGEAIAYAPAGWTGSL